MLDDRTVLRTDIDERYFRLWNNAANRFGWTSYLGSEPGAPDVNPLAAPAREENLAGLPPAWIGVGTLDLFFDEDVAYASRLRAAGVPCDLMSWRARFTASTRCRRRPRSPADTGPSRFGPWRPASASPIDPTMEAQRRSVRNRSAPKRPTISPAAPSTAEGKMLRCPGLT